MPSRSRRSSSATACSPSRPPRRPAGARPGGGFTLLEVLVALAILGIGLGVIFEGLGGGLRLRRNSEEDVRCAIAAETLLGDLAGRERAPESVEEGEDSGCAWRLEPLGAVAASAEPAAAPSAGAVVGGSSGATLVAVRITLTAPSGRHWQMSTLLPQEPPK